MKSSKIPTANRRKPSKFQFHVALQPGDVVDVVAPGSAVPDDILQKAAVFLESWNLVPRIPKNIQRPTSLHSNSDKNRFEFFKKALYSPDSKLIWSLRGGYGSNRLMPEVMKLKKPKTSKIFLGISDVTSLHVFLNQKWGWPSLHGSLLDRLASGKLPNPCQAELRSILFGEVSEVSFDLKPLNKAARSVQSIRVPVVGGNMMTLQSSLGTNAEFQTDNHFLFIEEIAERGYRVDRMLEHFRQCGKFKKCRGLLLGQFVGGAEADGVQVWREVLQNWAKELEIPVFDGIESGHGEFLRTLPLGATAHIKSSGATAHIKSSGAAAHIRSSSASARNSTAMKLVVETGIR